eukprot:12922998-Prorocentrum_lima.AAC.1
MLLSLTNGRIETLTTTDIATAIPTHLLMKGDIGGSPSDFDVAGSCQSRYRLGDSKSSVWAQGNSKVVARRTRS